MLNNFYSYLDGFNKITVITKIQYSKDQIPRFYLVHANQRIGELKIKFFENLGNEYKYVLSINDFLNLNVEYYIEDEERNRSFLKIGAIVRTEMFDSIYYYDQNDLGITYSKDQTTFKIWTPVAKVVRLELKNLNNEAIFHNLEYTTCGVWETTIKGDLEQFKYRYHVKVNEEFGTCLDPYGISSTANAKYNYVIDKNKTYQFKYAKPEFSGRNVDASIYEVHIRDFTIDESSGALKKGLYLGLTEDSKTKNGFDTGLNYIEKLGVSHVQLLPIYDFGGVDELNKNEYYNWGYNPEQYNVCEGWYSSNPNDPYVRINELKQLIDEIHRHNLRVSMDVVYNHVYNKDVFPFEFLVPGYFYRYDLNGIATNISGCGNDVASERKMVQKFIIDSIKWWMSYYSISAFRFDLMGLLDVDTMNKIAEIVKIYDKKAFVYGEGWNMPSAIADEYKSHMHNHYRMPKIAHFNDRFRETIKGSSWDKIPGFALGEKTHIHDVINLFLGSGMNNYLFFNPNQTINYVECHDNHTFYDRMILTKPNQEENVYHDYQALANSFVILAQGVPFIHAGQEFFRTKYGVENSYKSSDRINRVDFKLMEKNYPYVLMVRDLLEIRKNHSDFRLMNSYEIHKKWSFLGLDKKHSLEFKTKDENYLYVIIKNDYKIEEKIFDTPLKMIFNGRKKTEEVLSAYILNKPGIYLFKKE